MGEDAAEVLEAELGDTGTAPGSLNPERASFKSFSISSSGVLTALIEEQLKMISNAIPFFFKNIRMPFFVVLVGAPSIF